MCVGVVFRMCVAGYMAQMAVSVLCDVHEGLMGGGGGWGD